MVKPCGLNLSSMNGPVPTGLGSANVVGSPTDCQMCWGRMLTCPDEEQVRVLRRAEVQRRRVAGRGGTGRQRRADDIERRVLDEQVERVGDVGGAERLAVIALHALPDGHAERLAAVR